MELLFLRVVSLLNSLLKEERIYEAFKYFKEEYQPKGLKFDPPEFDVTEDDLIALGILIEGKKISLNVAS